MSTRQYYSGNRKKKKKEKEKPISLPTRLLFGRMVPILWLIIYRTVRATCFYVYNSGHGSRAGLSRPRGFSFGINRFRKKKHTQTYTCAKWLLACLKNSVRIHAVRRYDFKRLLQFSCHGPRTENFARTG